jgi:membrane dipeptidase
MKKIALCVLLLFACLSFASDEADQVRKILKETPLIDGHNDLAWQYHDNWKNHLNQVDLRSDTSKLKKPLHTDIARLRKGGVGGQFWSVYVPVDYAGPKAVQGALEQIDDVYRFTKMYPDVFEMAYTASDVERIHKQGKIASLIGVEGGHCINNSLAVLRQLYLLGARYMTLTHWNNTDWADAATAGPQHHGLSPFGEQVVREMNRLGMLVDLSHVSAETMNKVLDITKAPVIFSHSSARAISHHSRNVPDEVLKRIPENGGVVMVNFAPSFVSEENRLYNGEEEAEKARMKQLMPGDPDGAAKLVEEWKQKNPGPKATLQQVADHIDHIRKVAGIDYIGLGSDFDGITSTPTGLEDVSKYPDLLGELMRRGYSKKDIQKIAGLNVLRALRKTEQVAAELQRNAVASDVLIEEVQTQTQTTETTKTN